MTAAEHPQRVLLEARRRRFVKDVKARFSLGASTTTYTVVVTPYRRKADYTVGTRLLEPPRYFEATSAAAAIQAAADGLLALFPELTSDLEGPA